jgi:hypothetical protein
VRYARPLIAFLLAGAAAAWVLLKPAPEAPEAPEAVPAAVEDKAAAALPPPAAPEGLRVEVPSGQEVVFSDVIQGEPGAEGLTYRFRFIAPAIARQGGTVTTEVAHDDMQALCDQFALPRIAETGPQPSQIIISLSDRPVPFGEQAPEATQFFEGYRIEAGKCVWEMF